MENKIKKLNKKVQYEKEDGITKDKVIIRLKIKNVELTTKIVKIKGEQYQALLAAKTELENLKKEIEKVKTQVNTKANQKNYIIGSRSSIS